MAMKTVVAVFQLILLLSFLYGDFVFVLGEDIYRLSNNTKPLSYDLELTVDTDCEVNEFCGQVNITIDVLVTEKYVTLHTSTHINITTLEVYTANREESIPVIDTEYVEKTEIRTVKLGEDLLAGSKYIIEISYSAKISTDKLGFYQSSYINDEGEKVCLLSTQFAPTQARRAFPCYDEPSFKADYNIRIIHPAGTSALSNEIPVEFIHREDETLETIFDRVKLMPSYLVGFAITDFGSKENLTAGVLHQAYSRRNELNHVEFGLDFAAKVYANLANQFGLQLPLKQLKHVAIPDFYFSAMENWGMITYKESRFLFNPDLHPVNLEHSISNVIAHEVTHHWFGDLVTMKWWTHVWLKEGFATLYSYYGQDYVRPDHQAMQFLIAEKLQFVFGIDSDPTIKPMSKYIEIQSEIMANYDKIAYDKACCVLRMMRHAFTESVFKKALETYIDKNKYSNTEEEDLIEAIQTAMGPNSNDIPVSDIMLSWTQQSGYPVVSVQQKGSVIYLQQERFYQKKPKEEPVEPEVWWIPITFVNLNGSVTEYWMNESKSEIYCPDYLGSCDTKRFFLLNHEQIGYYRVNYDEEHWKMIAYELRTNHFRIHVNNRAQIIDDAFNLAFVGRLSYSILFDVVEYIGKEEEYAPWVAFKRGVSTLKQYLSGSPNIDRLNQYVQRVVDQAYSNVALSNNVLKFIRKFSRQTIVGVACEFGLRACLQEQRDYSYPDLREIFYCNKIRAGDNSLYATLRNLLKNTTEPILRAEYISSLGCSSDRSQLAVLLLMAIDKTENYMLTDTERVQLIQSVYRKSYLGVVETLNLFDNDNVKNAIVPTELEKMCLDFAKYINSYDLHIKFGKIMDKVMTTEKLQEAKAIIRENLFWIADFGATALNILPTKTNNANFGIKICLGLIISCLFSIKLI